MFGREKIAMLVAEFIGTFTLASVVLSMIARNSHLFFVSTAAGSALGLLTLMVGSVSGAHLNPAVTLGLWWIRQINAAKAIVFIVAQMLGGLAALSLSEYLVGESLPSYRAGAFKTETFVAEIVGVTIFTFGVSAAISQGYKGLKQAVTIGGSLSLGIMLAAFGAGGILNPAVAVALQSWNWAYFTGPLVGGLLGTSLYTVVFAPRPVKRVKAKVVASKTTTKKSTKKPVAKKRTTKKK